MSLKIENVSSRSGNKWALRDISFEAQYGSVFGICGSTGSGKTTLLRAVAGDCKTHAGTISLDTERLTSKNANDLGVSLVGHADAAGLLGLFGRKQPLSHGEQKLDSFETAIKNAERVMLLDDPFRELDNKLRHRCFQQIQEWVARGERVVIFTSSDFDQIAALAHNAAILSGGEIKQIGTPQEIYENPETVPSAESSGFANFIIARRLSSTDVSLPEFQTLDGSHRIFTKPAEKSRLGPINQNRTLTIRPEQISMSMGASFPGDNLIRAVVVGLQFLGATSLIEFDASGLLLKARVFKVVGLQIGDECMLSLPPDRILILKD